MDQVIGLFLLAVYIVAVVGLAAGITWVVVKLFPTERGGDEPKDDAKKPSSGDAPQGGRLFRRAKRGTA